MLETRQSILNNLQRLAALTDADNLTRLYRIRSNVHNLAINNDVLVKDKLTGSCTTRSNSKTINQIVETTLEKLKKNLTCNTLGTLSLLKKATEL